MTPTAARIIVVTGATGLQGGAVAAHLLRHGWHVRALTRKPRSRRAAHLARAGAEIVAGDMADAASLRSTFSGAYGVYSVQNPVTSGVAGEVRQGKTVANVAAEAGIRHLVYGSAGTGTRGTGIPSWESKVEVEEHMKRLGIPATILRPSAFMELMTEKKFFPAASTWHVMPELMGSARKVYWLAADDLGAIASLAFSRPDDFIGRALTLAADAQSIDECRAIYREVRGRNPPHFPLPVRIFERLGFVGEDLSIMWRWLRTAPLEVDPSPTRALLPGALTVRAWLSQRASQPRPQ
jgi:uncharacterized protein YbjT (DUF2867 family)